jgi:DNA-binding transcriptional LysR family regulator
MLDLRRLRLLRELALLGTIAAVAEALSFTPSAVSQQLSALEREAGVPLLERTGRRVTLTPAGHALVRHAEALLERLESAEAELAQARRGLTGPLRIGAFPTATRALLPAALVALARTQPDLEPQVVEMDPAVVGNALRAGEVDLALVQSYDFVPEPDQPGLATQPLCSEPMYLAAPRTAPEREDEHDPDEVSLAAYRDTPWITATPGTLCHTMTLRACQAAGFTPRVRHQVDDFSTVLALVAGDQGVAVVPELGLSEAPRTVHPTRLPMRRHTRIAFRAGAARHPAVSAATAAFRTAVPQRLLPTARH